MIRRIAITGPESTGKSELAKKLAEHYNTIWVPEFAREYLNIINRPYVQADILEIAKGQIESEDRLSYLAKDILFCDTEPIVTKIWSEHLYKKCDDWIKKKIDDHSYDLYLLCNIDIPWVPDPLREQPEKREYFFDLFYNELKSRNFNFSVISGYGEERINNAINIIDNLLE
jgi:NadR type nicotinamide-nucleotide adenylyltransferase